MAHVDRQNPWRWCGLIAVLVALSVRTVVIGLAPHADEGHYAAASYFQFLGYTRGTFAADSTIPPYGGLELYSLLFSWLYFLPGEPLLLFRLADAACASLAGLAMYLYLAQVTQDRRVACLTAVIAILAMNHPVFIEAGARNPIPAATASFFAAAYLLERSRGASPILPGLLLALAVLLREPFAPFAAVLMLYAWKRQGFGWTIRFVGIFVGGITFGFVSIAALKGGLSGAEVLINAYANMPQTDPRIHKSIGDRLARGQFYATEAATNAVFCLPLLVFGIIAPVFRSVRTTPEFMPRYLFGMALMLASVVEIAAKQCYAYHVAQVLLGGSIVMALGLQVLTGRSAAIRQWHPRRLMAIGTAVVVAQMALFADLGRNLRYAAGWSLHFAPVTILGDWSSPIVEEAYYLRMAALVRQRTKPGEVILSATPNIYPLTGTLPPTRETGSIAMYLLNNRADRLDEGTVSLVNSLRPALYIQEMPTSTVSAQPDTKQPFQYRDLYGASVRVGPGLSPYRPKIAQIHFNN